MGEIRWLSASGDERLEWDPADEEQVAAAKAKFDELKGQGFNFYEVAEQRGKLVSRFNKKAGKLLAAPGAQKAQDRREGTRRAAMAGGPVTQRS